MRKRRISKAKASQFRRAVETVEVAVTLPVLVLVMFSAVEICHRIHVQKLLRIATYEAMKAGASVDGDSQDAIDVFEDQTTALGISGAMLVFDRGVFNGAEPGDDLEMEGTAPFANNSVSLPATLSLSSSLSGGKIHYRKEGL